MLDWQFKQVMRYLGDCDLVWILESVAPNSGEPSITRLPYPHSLWVVEVEVFLVEIDNAHLISFSDRTLVDALVNAVTELIEALADAYPDPNVGKRFIRERFTWFDGAPLDPTWVMEEFYLTLLGAR